jgi:DNA polymerase-3 subunit epsilon
MLVLGLDFETTGLSPETDRIIEVGAVLWDTESCKPLQLESYYIKHPDLDAIWNDDIERITGIRKSDVEDFGYDPATAWLNLESLVENCAYIIAHHGLTFDKLFADAHSQRIGEPVWTTKWLDTEVDIEFPESISNTRKLVHLAAEHGFLNPFAHRAVFDVLTMLKVLACYDIEKVIAYSEIPWVKVEAVVSFDKKDLAKERMYRWDPDGKECGSPKTWWKKIKENMVAKEIAEAPFKVVVMQERLI